MNVPLDKSSVDSDDLAKITDPDEFIMPAWLCSKPDIVVEKKPDGRRKIAYEGVIKEPERKLVKHKAPINLNDCMSCSGCITSSEEVLVAQQSLKYFYDFLQDNKMLEESKRKILAVSISPQSKASIAADSNLSYQKTSKKLVSFLRNMGVDIVLDSTVGRELSLLESGKEFVGRFRENKSLPVFTSACPGWVSYVEKKMVKSAVNHLSAVKSAQQMTASIIKNYLAAKLGVSNPGQVFHISVAPCYDRKLEASRSDFQDKELDYKDVDCVLTTGELQEMIEKEGISLADIPEDITDDCSQEMLEYPDCWSHNKSESDGYLDYVIRYAAKELYNRELGDLDYKILRHADMQEVIIYEDIHSDDDKLNNRVNDKSGSSNENQEPKKPLLRFAFAYGYRKLCHVDLSYKRNQLHYDYIEVMACPTGCLNGRGQVPTTNLLEVKESYNSVAKQPVGSHPVVERLYRDWLDELSQEEFNKMTRTHFRSVPKNPINF